MDMEMTGSSGFFSVSSEHVPGLVALVIAPLLVYLVVCAARMLELQGVGWAATFVRRLDGFPLAARAALFGSFVGLIVHAALVPTHWGEERTTAILFAVDAVGFAIVLGQAYGGRRHWRLLNVAMEGGTAAAYGLYLLTGREDLDSVGLLTTTVELAAALILLYPVEAGARTVAGRERWVAAIAIPLALFSVLGTSAIASATQGADAESRGAVAGPARTSPRAMAGMSPRAMAGMSSAKTERLSLPTTSPAGPITWPESMGVMEPGMKMATGGCSSRPTAEQQHAAVALVNRTVAAAAPYQSLAAAKLAGYVPVTPTGLPVVHYINPAIYQQGHVLDPASIPVLVYVNTAHGAVLSAAMYLMPRSGDKQAPPQPGGCLTQWHVHTNLCFRGGVVVGIETSGSCPAGATNQVTPPMMHVWLAPVPGGPLTPDPSGLAQVEAATRLPARISRNGTA